MIYRLSTAQRAARRSYYSPAVLPRPARRYVRRLGGWRVVEYAGYFPGAVTRAQVRRRAPAGRPRGHVGRLADLLRG